MVIKERAEGNLVDENVHQSVRVLPHLAIIAKMTIMTKMTIKTKMAMMTKMTKRGWSLCSACTESGSPGCRWSWRSSPPSDEPFWMTIIMTLMTIMVTIMFDDLLCYIHQLSHWRNHNLKYSQLKELAKMTKVLILISVLINHLYWSKACHAHCTT